MIDISKNFHLQEQVTMSTPPPIPIRINKELYEQLMKSGGKIQIKLSKDQSVPPVLVMQDKEIMLAPLGGDSSAVLYGTSSDSVKNDVDMRYHGKLLLFIDRYPLTVLIILGGSDKLKKWSMPPSKMDKAKASRLKEIGEIEKEARNQRKSQFLTEDALVAGKNIVKSNGRPTSNFNNLIRPSSRANGKPASRLTNQTHSTPVRQAIRHEPISPSSTISFSTGSNKPPLGIIPMKAAENNSKSSSHKSSSVDVPAIDSSNTSIKTSPSNDSRDHAIKKQKTSPTTSSPVTSKAETQDYKRKV